MHTKDPLHERVDSELAVVVVVDIGVVCVGDNKDIRLCVNLQVHVCIYILAFIVYHLPTNEQITDSLLTTPNCHKSPD